MGIVIVFLRAILRWTARGDGDRGPAGWDSRLSVRQSSGEFDASGIQDEQSTSPSVRQGRVHGVQETSRRIPISLYTEAQRQTPEGQEQSDWLFEGGHRRQSYKMSSALTSPCPSAQRVP